MNPRLARFGLALTLLMSSALAQDAAFTYQGRLLNDGSPAQGNYSMRFSLYSAATDGALLGNPVEANPVPVANGLFTVQLDWGTTVFENPNLWLEIEVRTNSAGAVYVPLTPRQELTPAPRALVAQQANVAAQATTVASGAVTSEMLAPASVQATHIAPNQVVRSLNGLRDDVLLQAGTNTTLTATGPSSVAIHSLGWGLHGNAGTDPTTQFLGTTDEAPIEFRINAERVFRIERSTNYGNLVNVIGGHANNTVPTPSFGVVIAGGGAQYGDTAEGDLRHRVESTGATVGGGMANRIAENATYAVIAGGMSNSISPWAFESVISGGRLHLIETDADHGTIAGGLNNTIGMFSYFSTIGGGWTNKIRGYYSTISGGVENYVGAGGQYSTISGGAQNRVEDGSITGTIAGGGNNLILGASRRSSIGGGKSNEVHERSPHSTIGGGLANTIGNDAEGAVIPGGISNRVDGAHAFAAGHLAQASHPGTFVWADGSPSPFASSAANEMAVRATGGVRLVSAIDAGGSPTAGVVLNPGSGSWSNLSDREAKTGFEPVDSEWVLEQVGQLPLQTWRYRAEAESTRHLGPTAQDFQQAFGLGASDKTIATVDGDGVALAAIQGLYRLVQEQQTEIRQLRTQLDELRSLTRRRSAHPGAAMSADHAWE
jgi:hypothetical protein